MQSDPFNVWSRDDQPDQPAAQPSTQSAFQPSAQPVQQDQPAQLTVQPAQVVQPTKIFQPAAQPVQPATQPVFQASQLTQSTQSASQVQVQTQHLDQSQQPTQTTQPMRYNAAIQPVAPELAQPAQSSQPTTVFQPSAQPVQPKPQDAQSTFQSSAQTVESTFQSAPSSQPASSVQPTQSFQPAQPAPAQPNPIITAPAVTSMPDFAAAANAADSKKKPNKTIIYSAVAAAAVVLLVVGVFGIRMVLRAQAYSGAITAIDSVKNVAKKKEVNFSDNNSMTSDEMQNFFTKTGDAPDKTLFKAVKTPAEGIAKYRATMKQIINNRNTFDNKIVAEKVDATKEVYEKFINHADAATKFFKILNKYAKDMKEFNTNGINSNSPEYKKKMQKGLVLVKKLKAEMSSHKSSDKEFNKLANDLVDDLYNLVSTFAKEQPKGSSKQSDDMSDFGAVFGLMMKITDESKRLDTYFGDVANLRNQFIDSLADLRSTLVSKK